MAGGTTSELLAVFILLLYSREAVQGLVLPFDEPQGRLQVQDEKRTS
jgi:hypothetical protein